MLAGAVASHEKQVNPDRLAGSEYASSRLAAHGMLLRMPTRFRNYWVYSLGFFAVWGLVLAIISSTHPDRLSGSLLVFAGVCIAWRFRHHR